MWVEGEEESPERSKKNEQKKKGVGENIVDL